MNITLTTTWNPRGEEERLERQLPILKQVYHDIVVVYRPGSDIHTQELLEKSGVITVIPPEWAMGRYLALKKASETSADMIHYADMDRLLRWVETRPDEWRQAVLFIQEKDCVVFGRTDTAYQTHPQALIQTEKISNLMTSYFLEKQIDVSAGSKAFSRQAANFLIDQTQPRRSIGTDAEWLILLKRAGFAINYLQVDGLDFESADRYQSQAATIEQQLQYVAEVDADPQQWARRVEIALEIVESAIDAQKVIIQDSIMIAKPLSIPIHDSSSIQFDLEKVFEVDDYLYFYSESLTDDRTDAEITATVKLMQLDEPRYILDLACGYGRHTNRLAALGHHMTGVDIMPGFLEIARQDARERGLEVDYIQEDMRKITYHEVFDDVFVLFTAFGYFDDEENLSVMKRIYHALKPGGMVLFDTPSRDMFFRNMQPNIVTEKEGNLMIDRISFDSMNGRSINRRIVIRDGVRKDKPFTIRLYNPNEIINLLNQAGLELHQIYGEWDGQPLSPESRRMIIIGRKPGPGQQQADV
jgi:SAM-dependent methyltransferase